MIKKSYNNKILLIYLISFSFLFHLVSINFHPTNFEGAYGYYSDLFNSNNKIMYIKDYYISQFNTYLYSLMGSVLNATLPNINGFQAIKIISASSYIFLGFGIYNFLKFYNYKNNYIFFILIIFLNSIIFTYGFRAFNDLFAFSLAIFAFSRILENYNKKKVILDVVLLGFSISLKSYNLILLLPLLIFLMNSYTSQNKLYKIFFLFFITLLPIILYNFFSKKYLGFVFAPVNEDLQIAIIGNDKNRNIFWILNNFIFYIGYLTLISLPFFFVTFLSFYKKKYKIFYLLNIILLFFLSFYIQKFLFISSELDLGPFQYYIPEKIYKALIALLFFLFLFFVFCLFNSKDINGKQLKICKTIIITILLYLLALSAIKAAQRYLILPLPFIFLILFSYKQPRYLSITTLIFYMTINFLLLTNYYIVGKSTKIIYSFLESKQILNKTLPNVITPHVYHLYVGENKIELNSSDFKIDYYNQDAFFTSKIDLFGYEFKKYSVLKVKK